MNWHVDSGLAVLNKQLKTKYPGIIIGTIGDPKHQAEHSDHNPEADGSVDAADLMIGPNFTRQDCSQVMESLRLSRDQRIAYLIWDHQICSSTYDKWIWTPYHGNDPHTGHGHVSVNDKHHEDLNLWDINKGVYVPRKVQFAQATIQMPLLREGDSDNDFDGFDEIKRIQRQIFDDPKMWDGVWGEKTSAKLGMKTMTMDKYRSLFGMNLA